MITHVLHGEGKPRIVIPDTSPIITGVTISSFGATKYYVYLSGTPTLTDSVINRFCKTLNGNGNATKGKIISYDDATDLITIESWDNQFPALTSAVTIEDYIIDLPYCESLDEQFEPKLKEPKTYFATKKKKRELEGFYYYASLNYSSFSDLTLLSSLQNVYQTGRNNLYFYPRRDNYLIYYECEISADSNIMLAQLKYHQGHKNFVIELEGLNLLTKIDLQTSLYDTPAYQLIIDNS